MCFVTFNYDTLLEEAFTSFGRRFRSVEDYISRNDYMVIKLHGSVNWARELGAPMPIDTDRIGMANKMAEVADLDVSDNYHIIPDGASSSLPVSYMDIPVQGRQVVYPAIAIPIQKRDYYECPPQHVHELTSRIPETRRLLIVGWKAAEENFAKLLAKGLGKDIPKMIVSGSKESAEKTRYSLGALGGENWSQLLGGGFTDQVMSGRIANFIKKP